MYYVKTNIFTQRQTAMFHHATFVVFPTIFFHIDATHILRLLALWSEAANGVSALCVLSSCWTFQTLLH